MNGNMRYVHQDHLGSTAVVTDSAGNVVFERTYDPWGNVRTSTGTADTDRLFTGQRFDAATGLYYYNARYYDPTLGRFISPDTIVPGVGNPQAWNRYAYVVNNPLRYTDPSGHLAQCVVGAAVDGTYNLITRSEYTSAEIAVSAGLGCATAVVAQVATKVVKPIAGPVARFFGKLFGLGDDAVRVAVKSSDIIFDSRQVQSHFKHARSFNVQGNWNPSRGRAF